MRVDEQPRKATVVSPAEEKRMPFLRKTSSGSGLAQRLDDFFGVTHSGSTLDTEIRAGCIAWMTMSYIMVVNPVILSNAGTEHNPLLPEPVMTATALSASFGSLAAGLLGHAPLGLMPGMGLNAYFAYGLCSAFQVSWQEALSCSFVSGAMLLAFSVLGVCDFIVATVLSEHLKKAITVAIGVFQALIGFQVMGLVVASPDTLVTLGDLSWSNDQLYLALSGLCLISMMLAIWKIRGAMLIGIWLMAATAWCSSLAPPPAGLVSLPSFDALFCISFAAWSPSSGKLPAMVTGSLVLLFVALFDLAGVQFGLMGIAGLLKNDSVPRSKSIFASAGLATMAGSLLGTSPVIIANESSAGIVEGAKTGLMAVVVSLLFLLSAFIGPLLGAVPHVATAVPLVLIGAFMMAPSRGIEWDDLRVAIPSFLTVTLVPFTYSIHTGIIAGILMDGFLYAMSLPASKDGRSSVSAPSQASPSSKPLPSPHIILASKMDSRVDGARQLLSSLGPYPVNTACDVERTATGLMASLLGSDASCARGEATREQREELLRRALELFLEGRA